MTASDVNAEVAARFGVRSAADVSGVPAAAAVEVSGLSKRFVIGSNRQSTFLSAFRRRAMSDELGVDEDDDMDGDEDEEEQQPEGDEPRREIWALRDVSFAVGAGTALGIVGPHGSGKTTLLKILGRVMSPSEGRAVTRGTVAPLLDSAASLVQSDFTGRRNVRQIARFFGVSRRVVDARLDDVLALAGLRGMGDVRAGQYSSGLVRRLPLATVLHFDSDILLFDDGAMPADPDFRERCFRRIESMLADGVTLLLVSHDPDVLRRHCDRALLLHQGGVEAEGGVDEILARYTPAAAPARGGNAPRRLGFSADVALHGATVVPAGGVRVGAPLELVLEVEVATAGAVVTCGVVLERGGAPHLSFEQPAPFVAGEPGLYHVTVSAPSGVDEAGEYDLQVGARVEAGGEEARLLRSGAATVSVTSAGNAVPPPQQPPRWSVELDGEPVELLGTAGD